MGLSVDSIGAASAAYPRQPVAAVPLADSNSASVDLQLSPTGNSPALLGQRDQADFAEVGFGQGTISSVGAALRALDRTVEASRTMFDSLEEVRKRFREEAKNTSPGASESQSANQATLAATPIQLGRHQANAARQVRNFINALDQTAGVAQARVSGETPPATQGGENQPAQATFRVNGQTFSATLAPNAPRLDLLA
ncbi:MAG: hypothetical protein HZB26_25445 [Candidatus Hydrogenedentes bacterium]|nr:hypothetical protein [Candidatus Hydrogenedentota bacterium]